MDTPTTSEPSEPTQPEHDHNALIRLVHTLAQTVRHMNPEVVVALNKFKLEYADELADLAAPVDSPPAPQPKSNMPDESPNKPLR